MSATKVKELPPRLQDRYGYRRTPIPVILLAVVASVFVLTVGVWTALYNATPDVTSKLLAWKAVDASHTDITFEVRRDAAFPVECALRVQNRSHQDLGYAIVTLPPGTDYVQETYQVATVSLGFAAEVLDCATEGNLHAATPEFPPGTSNPPQPWRPS